MNELIIFQYAFPLVVVLAVMFLFMIFLFITARVHWMIRFIGVPLILAVSIFSYIYLGQILGYPYPGEIPEGSQYLGRTIQPVEEELHYVIWVKIRGKNASRLFLIPYSKKQDKEFRSGEAKGRKARRPLAIRKKEESLSGSGGGQGGGGSDGVLYELYPLVETSYPPKTVEQ